MFSTDYNIFRRELWGNQLCNQTAFVNSQCPAKDALCPEEYKTLRNSLNRKHNDIRDEIIAMIFPSTAEQDRGKTKYLQKLLLKIKERKILEEAQNMFNPHSAKSENAIYKADQTDNESLNSNHSPEDAVKISV